jgi:hypothetical protein
MKYKLLWPEYDDDMSFEIPYGWHYVNCITLMSIYGGAAVVILIAEDT